MEHVDSETQNRDERVELEEAICFLMVLREIANNIHLSEKLALTAVPDHRTLFSGVTPKDRVRRKNGL